VLRVPLDSDHAGDSVTLPTVMRLTSADSSSVASGDNQLLPYHVMVDDNTSIDHASNSDTEGLLKGIIQVTCICVVITFQLSDYYTDLLKKSFIV